MYPQPNTLTYVVKKCLDDEEFFAAVIKNPAVALEKAGITLSDEERTSLQAMVSNLRPEDMPNIRALVDRFKVLQPRDWEPGWPMGWVPWVKR